MPISEQAGANVWPFDLLAHLIPADGQGFVPTSQTATLRSKESDLDRHPASEPWFVRDAPNARDLRAWPRAGLIASPGSSWALEGDPADLGTILPSSPLLTTSDAHPSPTWAPEEECPLPRNSNEPSMARANPSLGQGLAGRQTPEQNPRLLKPRSCM